MLFQSWSDLWRILIVALLVYPALIAILRVSGKRTLGKMNAFDFVITVALGSTLATVLLSRDVSVAEGVVALALLVGLQGGATWVSTRSARARRVLKSTPTLLVRNGELLSDSMRSQRVTAGEVLQAARSQGVGDLSAVAAVVLETDGSFSVIPASQAGRLTTLRRVDGLGDAPEAGDSH